MHWEQRGESLTRALAVPKPADSSNRRPTKVRINVHKGSVYACMVARVRKRGQLPEQGLGCGKGRAARGAVLTKVSRVRAGNRLRAVLMRSKMCFKRRSAPRTGKAGRPTTVHCVASAVCSSSQAVLSMWATDAKALHASWQGQCAWVPR